MEGPPVVSSGWEGMAVSARGVGWAAMCFLVTFLDFFEVVFLEDFFEDFLEDWWVGVV